MPKGLLFLLLICGLAVRAPAQPADCPPSSQMIYWLERVGLDEATHPSFGENVFQNLIQPLSKLGYCLQPFPEPGETETLEEFQHATVLQIMATSADTGSGELVLDHSVNNVRVGVHQGLNTSYESLKESMKRPLASFPYVPGEPTSMEAVAARKVAENLKDRFICHLIIESSPKRINFQSSRGINGVTPVEWVLPVGAITLTANEKGYFPYQETLQLNAPGEHEVFIRMKKKRFYHSKFMFPAVIAAIGGGAAYFLERDYAQQYYSLGPTDRENRPQEFENTFNKAKTWERVKAGSLALSGLFFTLTFWF